MFYVQCRTNHATEDLNRFKSPSNCKMINHLMTVFHPAQRSPKICINDMLLVGPPLTTFTLIHHFRFIAGEDIPFVIYKY